MNIYENLEKLNIKLPEPPPAGGLYTPVRPFGDKLYYISGIGPAVNGKAEFLGKLGSDLTNEQGQAAARAATLNILAVIHRDLGDLNKIKSFVKMLALVASADTFYEQPKIIDASTGLLIQIFGEEIGKPARSAIGVNVLPGNIPVEIELLFEVK